MKREISISPKAEQEFDRLLDSIAARSPAGARATLLAFRTQLELLMDSGYPDRTVTGVELGFPICRINFGRSRQFCVLYRAAGLQVHIHFIGRAEQVHEGLRLEDLE
jgi:plasmid stabilization system protein ParE